jgi:hypothetical protein
VEVTAPPNGFSFGQRLEGRLHFRQAALLEFFWLKIPWIRENPIALADLLLV